MSRIGKKVIQIPNGVVISQEDDYVLVKGPKGELTRKVNRLVTIIIENGEVRVDVVNKEDKKERALWGTFGAHIRNMIIGVTEGYKKQLEINGVGYRVAMQGTDLKLEVGFSHSVFLKFRRK